ncbi:nitroreductase family protein [Gracilinema caldarium]|uniref:Nitroreductase n=1 Tax=Gracilinema caldarium (strain ATCC 51460 / DSM 7334 / H1) TaxID=744872 RepID=F8EYW9_GRAC1|nr:nitroreductase family protein [Gracilinema caldarium]AEJ18915.1 nitroreductase [Gracilinema caldarium DSM 7334]
MMQVDHKAHVILSAMERRYACKRFNPTQKIAAQDLDLILEAGRLAPSSFGLEHWHFFVSREQAMLNCFYEACFSQENIRTCAALITIAVRTAPAYHPESDFVRSRAERFPGGYPVFIEEYRSYWEFLTQSGAVEAWARSQGYIAAANMMTMAASLGIDSCAIEGYKEEAVLAILDLPRRDWRISLLLPLGYRDEPIREKIRMPKESIITGYQ